jgi:sugar transferase (PEP-CTERM/EpsH1 system associated)
MNLLHIVPSFGLGGMERVVCAIINHTCEKYDHEVLVVYDDTEAEKWIQTQNVKIHCLDRSKNQSKFLVSLYKFLNKSKPDIMMTYNWGATDAIWLGRLIGIKKIIHSEHGFSIDEARTTSFKRNVIRFFVYHMVSQIIVVSHELKTMMKKKYLISQACIAFIANGINSKIYFPDPILRLQMRKSLGFRDEDFVIGFSGRLDPIKNFGLMLNTFAECVRRDKSCRLLIVGDGSEREYIEQTCREKNIDTHVFLVGKKQDVVPYLQAMDVFLLTSLREQMPMTVLEAMALALPVVATAAGELPYLIQQGQQGIIWGVDEKPEIFAESLLRLKDKRILQSMGTAARQKILMDFTEDVMIEHYQKVIDGLAIHLA